MGSLHVFIFVKLVEVEVAFTIKQSLTNATVSALCTDVSIDE